jgi:hypothetical protein
MLYLGKIEVWAMATLDELMPVVENEKTEVEDTAGYWATVNDNTRLIQVPATRTVNKSAYKI